MCAKRGIEIYCMVFESETVPEDWTDAVPLYKVKGDKNEGKNYRELNLLCS